MLHPSNLRTTAAAVISLHWSHLDEMILLIVDSVKKRLSKTDSQARLRQNCCFFDSLSFHRQSA